MAAKKTKQSVRASEKSAKGVSAKAAPTTSRASKASAKPTGSSAVVKKKTQAGAKTTALPSAATSQAKPASDKSAKGTKKVATKSANVGAPAAKTAPAKPASAKPASKTKTSVLTIGDVVPEFEALNQDGELVQSGKLSGAPYVIYFYPKDDTPGCTTQACGFRDELQGFADHGVRIIGVSPDSPASHTRFRQKYGLEFTLLADTEKKLVSLFGVWKLKQNYGREYWGVERSTFLIDREGRVAKEWRGVKVAGHVPAVLEAAKAL